MSPLDRLLAEGVAAGRAPFAIGLWGRAEAAVWAGAAGEAAPGLPASPDTLLRLYSMTKAVGAFAAALLIDRGALAAETPVEEVLPEWREMRVLEGWDGETPRLRRPRRRATVADLAAHRAGLAYDHWSAEQARFQAATDLPRMSTGRRAALFAPLLFEPGEDWAYGIGIDWLGRVVEAVSGRRIDAFCRDEVFAPLGMEDTVFALDAARRARLAMAVRRRPDGGFAPVEMGPPPAPEIYGMGHALYGTGADYMRFLRMLLGGGALEGRRLIRAETLAALVGGQTGAVPVRPLRTVAPRFSADVDIAPGARLSHSFFALRVETDGPNGRRAGAQGWAGILNTHWWIDPARNVAGLLLTQCLPFAEPRFMALYAAFERAVCAAADQG